MSVCIDVGIGQMLVRKKTGRSCALLSCGTARVAFACLGHDDLTQLCNALRLAMTSLMHVAGGLYATWYGHDMTSSEAIGERAANVAAGDKYLDVDEAWLLLTDALVVVDDDDDGVRDDATVQLAAALGDDLKWRRRRCPAGTRVSVLADVAALTPFVSIVTCGGYVCFHYACVLIMYMCVSCAMMLGCICVRCRQVDRGVWSQSGWRLFQNRHAFRQYVIDDVHGRQAVPRLLAQVHWRRRVDFGGVDTQAQRAHQQARAERAPPRTYEQIAQQFRRQQQQSSARAARAEQRGGGALG